MSTETLARLWEIANEESNISGKEPDFVFDPVGLILVEPLTQIIYESTPSNSVCFAQTGGDGVHFSLLEIKGINTENSPVVMTVPMNFENENIIVGENLLDFLSLGCQAGYFFLEQFSYNWNKTVLFYGDSNNYFKDDAIGKRLITLLINEFNLQPWNNIDGRLQQLQTKYKPMLEFSN
ncbi:MAG: hypothetical protein H7Y59_05665 [Anaerolineales bacterium]|nr:hypothetical protein [Anaerolineales bacterium]